MPKRPPEQPTRMFQFNNAGHITACPRPLFLPDPAHYNYTLPWNIIIQILQKKKKKLILSHTSSVIGYKRRTFRFHNTQPYSTPPPPPHSPSIKLPTGSCIIYIQISWRSREEEKSVLSFFFFWSSLFSVILRYWLMDTELWQYNHRYTIYRLNANYYLKAKSLERLYCTSCQ